MLFLSKRKRRRLNLSSQAKILSIVRNRSLKITRLNIGLRPLLAFLRFRLLAGILGFMPKLKIFFRFALQSYTPSKLMVEPLRFIPILLAIWPNGLKASLIRGDSFLLPGANMAGETTLQFRSQMATTLSPLLCLCPLYPKLSPPFFSGRRRAVAMKDTNI